MSLFVVRHGQTEWNLAGRVQGHTDIPLDETGLAQACALGRRFGPHKGIQVLSSDLLRASQTAREICRYTGSDLVVTPLLRERSLGDLEGLGWHEYLVHGESMDDPLRDRLPNGESIEDAWVRIDEFMEKFDLSVPTAVVTHGGVGAVLLAHLMKGNLETTTRFRFANTSFTEFRRRANGSLYLHTFNCTSHLDGDGIPGDIHGVAK